MTQQQYAAKDIIFYEGEEGATAYTILDGSVEILKHGASGEVVLGKLEPGEVFGEMSLFQPGSARSATARAATDVIVDTIDAQDFLEQLNQCPHRIIPVIMTVIDRLRSSNQRLSKSEQATVILDSDIDKITISSNCDELQFAPVTAVSAQLPFKIGGYSEIEGKAAANKQNHLNLPCSGPPLMISHQHCQIEINEGGLFLRDIGSRHTTFVNGQNIGRGKGIYKVPLQKGPNDIQLGSELSPYRIIVDCA